MYETGVSIGVADLIDKIKRFAEKNQWPVDKHENNELYLHNGGNHYILTCDETETSIDDYWSDPAPYIYLACATGFDASEKSTEQPGIGEIRHINGLYSPFIAYHLFGADSYIHCAVEINTGLFAHFGFGVLEKTWAYSGGGYYFYTYWDSNYSEYNSNRGNPDISYHDFPFESSGVVFDGAAIDAYSAYPRYEDAFLSNRYHQDSPNQMNGVAALMPFVLTATADGGGNTKYFLGTPPDIRSTRMDYLQPGEAVTLGNDEWMCFPIKRKALSNVPNSEFSSGTYGIAYKKI